MVVGFGKKGWVTVEDEDGFEIPVPERECVVVEENAAASEGKNIQTKDGEKLNIALAYDKAGAGFACSMANECNYNLLATYSVQTVLKDGKFLYTVMEVVHMPGMELTAGGCHFPPALLADPSPEVPAFYRWVVGGLRMIVENQGEAAHPFKVQALEELTNLPEELGWLKEEN